MRIDSTVVGIRARESAAHQNSMLDCVIVDKDAGIGNGLRLPKEAGHSTSPTRKATTSAYGMIIVAKARDVANGVTV